MRIGVPAESRPGETRVAVTPETVKKLAVQHELEREGLDVRPEDLAGDLGTPEIMKFELRLERQVPS